MMASARAFSPSQAPRVAFSTWLAKERVLHGRRMALKASKTELGRVGKGHEEGAGPGRRKQGRREVQWAAATWLVGLLGTAGGAWGRPTSASTTEGPGGVARSPKEEEEGTQGEAGPPLYDAKSVPTRSSIAWKAAGAVGAMLATTLVLEQRLPAIQRAKRAAQKMENLPSEEEAWEDAPTEVTGRAIDDVADEDKEEQKGHEEEQDSWQAVQEGLQEARNRSQQE